MQRFHPVKVHAPIVTAGQLLAVGIFTSAQPTEPDAWPANRISPSSVLGCHEAPPPYLAFDPEEHTLRLGMASSYPVPLASAGSLPQAARCWFSSTSATLLCIVPALIGAPPVGGHLSLLRSYTRKPLVTRRKAPAVFLPTSTTVAFALNATFDRASLRSRERSRNIQSSTFTTAAHDSWAFSQERNSPSDHAQPQGGPQIF